MKATPEHLKAYRVEIAWSADDEVFFARIPALPDIFSHGDTPEAAVRNAYDALDGAIETLKANGYPVPEPDEIMEEIRRYERFLNKAELARQSGIKYDTLKSKLRRGTRFTEDEARRIKAALTF